MGLVLFLLPCFGLQGQCNTTTINGNLTLSTDTVLSGVYQINGNFVVPASVNVTVQPFDSGGCGVLEIHTTGDILIQGSISADSAGYPGGTGGNPGGTNNATFIQACSSPTDICGDIFTFGGIGGLDGGVFPGGGGQGGNPGVNGSGRKNQCLAFGDRVGRAGGSGGAGAGAGGAYAGSGRAGGNGGPGSLAITSESDGNCTNNPIVAGAGGNGGNPGNAFGTATGFDIDIGSGGGGAGGGGRGRTVGSAGENGGNGGGAVWLDADGDFTFSGTITANGSDGGNGGIGGNAGRSSRCCSDLCEGVDEYTHTGAGGGGGGGGGGAGGGILVTIRGIATISGNFVADGGDGGPGGIGGVSYGFTRSCFGSTSTASAPAGTTGQAGGAGSGGRIKIFFNQCAPGNSVAPNTQVLGGSGNAGAAPAGTVYIGTDSSISIGSMSPLSQTVCFGGDPLPLFSLPANGGYDTIIYSWQEQPGCTGGWNNIPGADSLTYDPPAGATQNTCYRLLVFSGTCLLFADTLQVNVLPPVVPAISPAGSLAICQGDTVTYSTSGGTNATYQWLYNGLPVTGATDSVFDATQIGSYAVRISYPSGCDGLSNAAYLDVQAPPQAIAVALGNTVLCPGESVQLQAFGGATYQWLLNGNPVPGGFSNTYQADSAGQWSVVATSGAGCADTATSITVSLATPPTSVLTSSGNTSFCDGDSVLLQATGGQTYAWQLNGATLPAQSSASLWATQNGQYTVVAIDSNGCRDTSAQVPVTVFPIPQAGLTPATTQNICLGDSLLLVGSGGGQYQWTFNTQALSGDTLSFLIASTPGDYAVIVTGNGGCTDTSLTYALTVFPPIQPGLSITGSPFICPGDTVLLTGFGGVSFQWFMDGNPIPGATQQTLAVTATGSYSVLVGDLNGCEAESRVINILPGLAPNAAISQVSDPLLCEGETVILVAQGGDQFQWFRDGQAIPGATDSLLTVSETGQYFVVVRTNCGSDTSTAIPVQVVPGPEAGFLYNNLPRYEVEFIDQSISAAQWQWFFGTGDGSTLQNPAYTYPDEGEYTVTLIVWDIFGCSDTITQTILVKDPEWYLPNVFSPNGDGVNDVAWTNWGDLTGVVFRIHDRWGREVFFTDKENEYWDGNFQGKACPEGVYFYRLDAEDYLGREVLQQGPITLLR